MKPIVVDSRSMGMEFFKDPAGWLYSDWTKEKYEAYLQLNSIKPIQLYMDYLLDKRSSEEYMKHNQLDWDDIHDPRKLSLTGAATALNGYALNFFSRNVEKLYR